MTLITLGTTSTLTVLDRFALSDFYLFAGKWLKLNQEVNAEIEAYFKGKDKSFYKKDIEIVEKRWHDFMALQGN